VSVFTLTVRSTKIPVQRELRAIFTGLKDMECEAPQTRMSSAKVNNVCICAPLPLCLHGVVLTYS
jgi:hypothetical protein